MLETPLLSCHTHSVGSYLSQWSATLVGLQNKHVSRIKSTTSSTIAITEIIAIMSSSMKRPSTPTNGPPRSIFGGPYATPPPGNGKAAVPRADTPIRDAASPVLESIKRKRSGTDNGTDFAKRALNRDGALSTAKVSPVRTHRNAGAAKSKLKFKPTCGYI